MDDTKFKNKILKIVLIFATIVVVLLGYDSIIGLIKYITDIFSPFILGGILALIVNIPMRYIEKKIFRRENKVNKILKRPTSIVLSALLFVIVFTLIGFLILPKITETIGEAANSIPKFIRDGTVLIKEKFEFKEEILLEINKLQEATANWGTLSTYIASKLSIETDNSISTFYGIFSNAFGSIIDIIVGIVFAFYMLMEKEKIFKTIKRMLIAFLPKKAQVTLRRNLRLLHKNFEEFLTGQCLGCAITAMLFTVLGLLFKFECSLIVGVCMLVLSLIPYIGNFMNCAIGIILTLAMEGTERAIWFAILFGIIQVIDGYFIYPKVIGAKVNMPPILVFVSAVIGGELFGIIGLVFMIPVVTTFYIIAKHEIKKHERKLLTDNIKT